MAYSKARRLANLMSTSSDEVPAARRPTIALAANTVDSDQYVDGSIDLVHMSSESVDEDNLQISNAGTNGQYLQKSSNTGGLTWADVSAGLTLETTPKDANFTAVAGKRYLVDTSSSAFTMTFPASPSVGDTVGVIDYAGTFNTNNLTLGRNSVNVLRAAEDGVINTQNWATDWMYAHATPGWIPVGG